MKKILALALALMMLLGIAAVVHAEGVEITYMASQDWVQDAEIALADKFTEKTGIKVDFQIIPAVDVNRKFRVIDGLEHLDDVFFNFQFLFLFHNWRQN